MAKHGLVVNRMPAVDGRALSRDELLQESTKIAAYLQPRGNIHSLFTHSYTTHSLFTHSLTHSSIIVGVIGCYLSHKRFWQMVVDNKYESAIVFEGIRSMTHSVTYTLTYHLLTHR